MTDTQKTPPSPISEVLRTNIKRIREAQRLTYVALSERLTEAGRPIPVLGLRRIERGERRVDVDDLAALALSLGVHPVDLLVPGDAAPDEAYNVTPTVSTTAAKARGWISGTDFLIEPKTAAELAEAIRWMPNKRAQAIAAEFLRPEQRFGHFDESNTIGMPSRGEQS